MSAHNLLQEMYQAQFMGVDPGASGSFVVDKDFVIFPVISAAAEARTLPVPVRPGLECLVHLYTDGGTVTLTVTSGYDQAGNTSITFDDVGDWVLFRSIQTALDTFRWRVVAGQGTNVAGASATSYSATTIEGTTVSAGESGTAGTLQVFPETASRGKLAVTCANQTGDTTVSVAIAAMGQATAVNLADPGAAASYLVQSTLALTLAEADVLKSVSVGVVSASKALVVDSNKDLGSLRNLKLSGAVTKTAGAATPAVAMRLGKTETEGYEIKVYDEVITLTNAVTTATTLALPAGAIVLCAQANLESAVVGDASGDDLLAKVGLGIAGTVVKFGVTSGLTKNLKIDTIPASYAVSAGETLGIFGIKADGSTACTEKFVGGETVRVRVAYAVPNSLDDAA
jgi:hypothetical protein